MKIIRDGREYELTTVELDMAYLEREKMYARTNILENLRYRLSQNEYEFLSENEDFIKTATDLLIEYQDGGHSYEEALDNAIRNAKSEYI